jgi:hypothetical protein
MEQRKELRGYSIVLIVLGIAELFKFVTSLIIMIKDGSLEAAFAGVEADVLTAVKITTYVILGLCALLTLADVAIGIKGIKIAKKPDSSKAHIVWGILLTVLTAIGLISPFLALVQGSDEVFANISALCSIVVDLMVLFDYVKYAIAVRKKI